MNEGESSATEGSVLRGGREPSTALFAVLVLVRVAIVVIAIVVVHRAPPTDADLIRFHEVALEPGRPYRDFTVEYPPGQLASVDLLVTSDVVASATRLALFTFVCDLATAGVLARTWGRRAAAAYLLIGLPLVSFVLLKLDALAVLLAVAAAAASRKGRERFGGVLLAAATSVRLWPVVLIPAMVAARRLRTAAWAAVLVLFLIVVWIGYGGLGAPMQALTFRGASGWEIGSTVGTVVWIATGEAPRVEAGAFRVGSTAPWETAVIVLGLIAALALIARRQRSDGASPDGAAAAASVAAVLFFSPVVSTQYALWLIPWAGIAWSVEDDAFTLATTAGIVAATLLPVGLVAHPAWFRLVLLLRDLAFGVLVMRYIVGRRAVRPADR